MANIIDRYKGKDNKGFAMAGLVLSGILLALYIVLAILDSAIHTSVDGWVWGIIGLAAGVVGMIFGIVGIMRAVANGLSGADVAILVGAVFMVLMPLGWFWGAGIALSVLAGISFIVYLVIK